jgi:hypothetical protein
LGQRVVLNVNKLLDEVEELRDGFRKQLEAVQTGRAQVVPLPGIPDDDLLEPIQKVVESDESDVIPSEADDSPWRERCGSPNIA